MYTTAADVAYFERLIARLQHCGSVPVALYGAGRVAEQLEPGRFASEAGVIGIIEDDPARRGSSWAGLPILSSDDAIARGVKAVIITAEGGAQDAIWSNRRPLIDAGMQVLCCPPRFASRTWDSSLIGHYEHNLASDRGLEVTYTQSYPAADHAEADWLLAPLKQAVADAKTPTICEIGTGSGLWTRHIIEQAKAYHAVDYSERLLFEVMEHRFAPHRSRLHLHHDETARLDGVEDASIDVLFSFDVFVHFKIDLVHQFLTAFARVLKPGATALVHFVQWNDTAISEWQEREAATHVGGHTIMFYNDPDWLATSAQRLSLAATTIAQSGSGFLMQFARA